VIVALYSLANLFLVATWNSEFWDSWVLYRNIPQLDLIEKSCPISRCKVPLTYLWEQPLLLQGVWALRIAVVVGFALSGFLFWRILGQIPQLGKSSRAIAFLTFLLLPINGARVGLSTARASLMLTTFLFGALLLTYQKYLVLFLGLFAISFSAFQPSFQIFAVSAVIPLIANDLALKRKISSRTLVIGLILLIQPILHRLFFSKIIVDAGFAAPDDGYNNILPAFLIRALLVCGLLSGPFLLSVALHVSSSQPWANFRTSLIQIGLLVLALGTFPYMAVGHFANLSDWVIMFLPDTSDWDSRHQLLQGPGYALILTGLITKVKDNSQHSLLLTIIISCLVLNTSTYANYYVDGLKQRDVISALRSQSADLDDASTFVFVDEARDLNARGRGVRDYEWDALTEEALGRQVKIIGMTDTAGISGCVGEKIGKTVTIRKISGRLKALITRSRVVDISVSDLIACK
jgi:hypothetical protein